ncbi:hypothetical protein [Actinomadura madurae]|uniref:hypothetical protein n=1 Tax=Actinomadura madurae TaxID=1993 RepID=UPI0020D246FB|nr:hypothetical protein [Actinomadura madurae]MCP9948861.1 hypothetical protein [Actinomadura madurae]MCQ0014312.1 hypothetical protein [Actinomadura madurae]
MRRRSSSTGVGCGDSHESSASSPAALGIATEWISTSVSTARSRAGGTHPGSFASSAATSSR